MTEKEKTLASTSHIALLVLSLVNEGPMYGYRIIKELDARSQNHFQLKEGSLYPVLHQLEKDRLVKTAWRQQRGKPNRRYYTITAKGRKALAQAKDEFDAHVKAVRLILEFIEVRVLGRTQGTARHLPDEPRPEESACITGAAVIHETL